jgi:hypothetical protein
MENQPIVMTEEMKKEWKEDNARCMRFYYKTHQERYKKKYDCECGGRYQIANKSAHEKTKKHQVYISTL